MPVPNTESNRSFFESWTEYQSLVDELDTYRFTRQALQGTITGRVLDIGNGGVFNYDLNHASEVRALDLVDFSHLHASLPEHVHFDTGDATSLCYETSRFNTVVAQMLVHHLAEDSFEQTSRRVDKFFSEAFRVLRSNGKLVLIESFLPPALAGLEKIAYPLQCRALRAMKHPLVFQWSKPAILRKLEACGFYQIDIERIERGRWMILLGRKWPTLLSPLQNFKIVATKA